MGETLKIYTDGACKGNNDTNSKRAGGWCAILQIAGKEKIVSGAEFNTTNNIMELKAVVEALKVLPLNYSKKIEIVSDSQYVVKGSEWLPGWIKNNWTLSNKKRVANKELWQQYILFAAEKDISFTWVRGHAGHKENIRCDEIAVEAAERLLSETTPDEYEYFNMVRSFVENATEDEVVNTLIELGYMK